MSKFELKKEEKYIFNVRLGYKRNHVKVNAGCRAVVILFGKKCSDFQLGP